MKFYVSLSTLLLVDGALKENYFPRPPKIWTYKTAREIMYNLENKKKEKKNNHNIVSGE